MVGLLGLLSTAGAAPIHRCEVGGAVTFQNAPCAAGESTLSTPRGVRGAAPPLLRVPVPGSQRAYRAAAAPALAEERARLGRDGPGGRGPAVSSTRQAGATAARAPETGSASQALSADGGRRCDGRTHCSQMTSCAEARWFLSHCPDVKMDGDGDGTRCEVEHCGH